MNPGASIIIVTYNSASTIAECLSSVAVTLRLEDEVLVIDNNSRDRTLEVVSSVGMPADKIRVLPQSKNYGFSKGCNIGIENSSKEYIILLNPDTDVLGDWIGRLISHFRNYDKTGAVGPLSNATIPNQHITTYFPEYHDYVDDAGHFLELLVQRFDRRSIPSRLLIGFCLAFRRDLIEKYGGLDEDIFLGDDDFEISWRLREKGYLLRVALDVFVNHANHVSFNTLPNLQTDKMVQQGSDVLLEKMQAFYAPAKVPNPNDYFGISWWKPSILEQKSEDEVFAPRLPKDGCTRVLLEVKQLLKAQQHDAACDYLRSALRIWLNDYNLWYTLGSLYLALKKYEDATAALKNAWSLEFGGSQAKRKLAKLYHETGCVDEFSDLLQSEPV